MLAQGLCWPGFKLRRGGALRHSVANTDKLQCDPRSRIAEARLCQPHDPRIAAATINKARGNHLETELGGLLVAQNSHDSSSRVNHRRDGHSPLLPGVAFAPLPPLIRVAISRSVQFVGF